MEVLKCQITYSSLYKWVISIFELEPIFKTPFGGHLSCLNPPENFRGRKTQNHCMRTPSP